MRLIVSALSGGLFGLGLYISGMTNTLKVQGFLDLFGQWDPTLMFVMGGAIIPMFFAWRFTAGRTPKFAASFPPKPDHGLDTRLVIGSAMFGAGWGLAGLCPGPSVASLSFGGLSGVIFFVAMAAGMWLAPRVKAIIPVWYRTA